MRQAGSSGRAPGSWILLYPFDAAGASENIDAIWEAYKEEFEQQSVLRTDSIDCVSF
ncbi:MAG: DUF3574 domain-containing protein [Gammaproteobacteria bacterium]